MLVSSIGYFNVQKTVVHNSVIKDKTANKSSLNEGFGYSTAKKQNNDTSFMKTFIDSFKSLFMKKSDESSKYLELIA
jgi:hypothetical protein